LTTLDGLNEYEGQHASESAPETERENRTDTEYGNDWPCTFDRRLRDLPSNPDPHEITLDVRSNSDSSKSVDTAKITEATREIVPKPASDGAAKEEDDK
jgi:hypothetical protein